MSWILEVNIILDNCLANKVKHVAVKVIRVFPLSRISTLLCKIHPAEALNDRIVIQGFVFLSGKTKIVYNFVKIVQETRPFCWDVSYCFITMVNASYSTTELECWKSLSKVSNMNLILQQISITYWFSTSCHQEKTHCTWRYPSPRF